MLSRWHAMPVSEMNKLLTAMGVVGAVTAVDVIIGVFFWLFCCCCVPNPYFIKNRQPCKARCTAA